MASFKGKRKIEFIDLTDSSDQPRKEARSAHSTSVGCRIAAPPRDIVSFSQVGGTQADEDERGASELVDASQGIDEDAFASFQLYGIYYDMSLCMLSAQLLTVKRHTPHKSRWP